MQVLMITFAIYLDFAGDYLVVIRFNVNAWVSRAIKMDTICNKIAVVCGWNNQIWARTCDPDFYLIKIGESYTCQMITII